MKKLFSLLIIAMSMLVSCQKTTVEPAPVANTPSTVMTLTDSTKAALFGTSFTIVFDHLAFDNNNMVGYPSPTHRRMYDEWTIDAIGNCTVTPYYYECPSSYVYDSLNFSYTKVPCYPPSWTFSITITEDTMHLPPINPFYWTRTGTQNNTFLQDVRYHNYDIKGIGRRSFTYHTPDPNVFSNYSIK